MKNKLLILGVFITLVGCGGGGGSSSDKTPSETLSGTAAAGAAIIGQVIVKGSAGASISTDIEADGSYSVDVSSLLAPYMLRATGRVGGKEYKLHSFAEKADIGGTINITPFTDLILANVAGELASSRFDNGDFSNFTPEDIEEQEAELQNKLSNVLNALGVSNTIDLLRTKFSANHSGLDAALDIIRIETNQETNIATIRNFIDGQSIEDDLENLNDEIAPLVVLDSAGLSSAQLDLLAISNRLSVLTGLFSLGLPQVSQLNVLFADDTLNNDSGKSQFLTDISSDPSLIDIIFSGVTYEEYDQNAGTAIIQFSVTRSGVLEPEPVRWYMAKNEGVWQFRGDQEIADIWFGFICHDSPEKQQPGCGVNVGVEDNDFSNTPGAEDTPIASAKFSILREGALVTGSEIYLGLADGYSTGELSIYDDDYGDDYIGFGNSWSNISASVFQAGDVAQIELFTEALDLSLAQNPQIDPSATPVQIVTRSIIAAPVSQATNSMFPSVSADTITGLARYSNGNLDVEWTVPSGFTIEEIWLEVSQGENDVRVDDRTASGNSGSKTITLDTSSLDTYASNFTKELRVYGKNEFGQSFLASYDAVGVDEPVPQEPNIAGVLSSLVGTWEFTGDIISREGYNATFLTLTDTGEFFFFNIDDESTDSCRKVGYEYGTYVSTSSEISLTSIVDTNGCVGIFDSSSVVSLDITINSNNSVAVYFGDEPDLDITMQRVVASEDGILGAWHEPLDSIEGNGLSQILLFLDDNTFYIMDANPSNPAEDDFKFGDYELNTVTDELSLFFDYNSPDSDNSEDVVLPDVVISKNKMIFDGDETSSLNRVISTNPFGFSLSWLAGRTLYDVSHSNNQGDDGRVSKFDFSENGSQVTCSAILNEDCTGTFNISIDEMGRMVIDNESVSFEINSCGGTSDYLEILFKEDNELNNIERLYFTEEKAIAYANTLTQQVPNSCL